MHHENPRKTCTQNRWITDVVDVMSAMSEWRAQNGDYSRIHSVAIVSVAFRPFQIDRDFFAK
jgi:hypothetical protein